MRRRLRDIEPGTGIMMGTAFLAGGLTIVFIALGWIRGDPASVHAPSWVLAVCGGMFALPGAGMLYYAFLNRATGGTRRDREGEEAEDRFSLLSWLMGLVIAARLTAVAGWVAFGPGERSFSGGVGVGPLHFGGRSTSETLGRAVFGVGGSWRACSPSGA